MLSIYNSLSGNKEDFVPLSSSHVGVYTCGPTVYNFVTIGNWRTYTLGDLVVRTLSYKGLGVTYIMNITDVGHLTGDNLGDADTGEDRLEQASRREDKTAWDIAEFYTNDFLSGYKKLNLSQPKLFTKATDHIAEQIELIEKLEANGFAYKITDGIYFDTVAYESAGYTYGELSNLKEIKEGARVEINPEKRNPRDFALWKFSPTIGEKRQMEWESPWGVGFPGWHIECSAMSMKYLGKQFDIHLGGEDLKSTHHPNEIAQSEGATGVHPFVKYWMHGAFLLVDGGKMGKSLGNAYTLTDIEAKGFSPLALRYFYLGGHYRTQLNFTWEGLTASSHALAKLHSVVLNLKKFGIGAVNNLYKDKFISKLENDLNMSEALAVIWELIKDPNISGAEKLGTLYDFDKVLGLGFELLSPIEIPEEITLLLTEREATRENKDFARSDELRTQIEALGYLINDTPEGQVVSKK
jgi:cysteinyl-tRNA synthetase